VLLYAAFITNLKNKNMKQETKCYCGHTDYCDCGLLEEPKQETLEEAAEKLILEYQLGNTGKIDIEDAKEMLIEFAKYQAERMYSEEEVMTIFFLGRESLNKALITQEEALDIIKQFNKKLLNNKI
jgi:hypothetical protein